MEMGALVMCQSTVAIVPAKQGYFLLRVIAGKEMALLDRSGKELWRQKLIWGNAQQAEDGVACAGDVDGDGQPEVAASYNNGAKVKLLDKSGKVRWQVVGNQVNSILMADVNGDGKQEIIFDDSHSALAIFSATGKPVKHLTIASASGGWVSLFKEPGKAGQQYLMTYEKEIMGSGKDQVLLMDFNGKSKTAFAAPRMGIMASAKGVPVKLAAGQPAYTAVLIGAGGVMSVGNPALCVYDAAGALVYEEVLADDCQSIAAVPVGKSGQEMLLLGIGDQVVQYRAAGSTSVK